MQRQPVRPGDKESKWVSNLEIPVQEDNHLNRQATAFFPIVAFLAINSIYVMIARLSITPQCSQVWVPRCNRLLPGPPHLVQVFLR